MQAIRASGWMSHRYGKRPSSVRLHQVKGILFTYLFGLILLAFVCSLFYIWSRVQIVNVGYEINRGLYFKDQLQEENKRLILEVATLKSPLRLEQLAKNEYQMDLPTKEQVLSVSSLAPLPVALASSEEKKETPPQALKNVILKSQRASKNSTPKKEGGLVSEKNSKKVTTLARANP